MKTRLVYLLVFAGSWLVGLLVFGGVAWWLLPADTGWILAVIAGAVGYMVPTLVLDRFKIQKAKRAAVRKEGG